MESPRPIPQDDDRREINRLPFDATALRADLWNDLKYCAHWIHDAVRHGLDVAEPRARVEKALAALRALESSWVYPGRATVEELSGLLARGDTAALDQRCTRLVRWLAGGDWSPPPGPEGPAPAPRESTGDGERRRQGPGERTRPHFTVLVVDAIDAEEERELCRRLLETRRDEDPFTYDVLVVRSFEDAVIASLFNHTIETCVIRFNFPFQSTERHEALELYLTLMRLLKPERTYGLQRCFTLGRVIKSLRPEMDLFLVTDAPLKDVAGGLGGEFQRVFYRLDNYLELHLSILKSITERFDTPFFTALRRYSSKPTGVFHALPISRGKSVVNSGWIRDMAEFYGTNIFLAETSATGGGLDSLLQPLGPLKRAQESAARAFGARRTFFVTNGTSTANKIVMQALVRPGDVVLVSRDCHKSVHYALVMAGADVVYLDPYPLPAFSMYGGVPLSEIKARLEEFRDAGTLDRVRMLVLTNCTFDGITYDPERVMREVLAIKPDMIFHWDEAWFAFARFSPLLRRRTAMASAERLRSALRNGARPAGEDPARGLDPARTRIRVYATQSTHKTLTALRQASMIHVHDEDFDQQSADAFSEAYMTHTSTSPNYQILASMDLGRRQVELEGYGLVRRSIGLAMALRERIYEHPVLRGRLQVLRPAHLIPAEFRPSGIEYLYDPERGYARTEEAWLTDEFTLDPTRVTVLVGRTGMDGNSFKNLLLDEHDIQINKTSRNSVLFMSNIGMTRGDVAYLVEALANIVRDLDARAGEFSGAERRIHDEQVRSLMERCPPLPNFSRFHDAFRRDPEAPTPEGDMRKAFFLAYDQEASEYVRLDGALRDQIAAGREVVSSGYVTPYPPGFPVLAPGQVISREIVEYLLALDVREIHGYRPQLGLRVFKPSVLAALAPARARAPAAAGG